MENREEDQLPTQQQLERRYYKMITDKYSKGCLTRYQTMTVFFILVGIHSTGYILYGLNFYLLMPERFECL